MHTVQEERVPRFLRRSSTGHGILPIYDLAAQTRIVSTLVQLVRGTFAAQIQQEAPFGGNMYQLSIKLLITAVVACSLLLAVPSFADSHTRIVRLSDVHGDVQIDRNTGQGYEKALVNLPLTKGVKIQTKQGGRAEVEFEDGSTLRITPDAVTEFPQLSLRDSGAEVSTISVQQGTAYVDFSGARNDEFTLTLGHEKLALRHPAHLRVEMGDTDATVAVFKGDIQVEGPSGTVEVAKNRTVTVDQKFQVTRVSPHCRRTRSVSPEFPFCLLR